MLIDRRLTVIIVSYNNLTVLIDCLDSIKKYNDIGNALEVIVVDNSTSNKIYNYIVKNYGWVIIKKNDNNGYGGGNNVGAKIATGEYLLFLNPDTILVEPVFDFAIEKFKNNSDLTIFGVKMVDNRLNGNQSFFFIDRHDIFHGQLTKILNRFNIFLSDSMYISGANIFVRKKEFYNAGMFDEEMFMYYEEPDLTKRIKQNGGKVGFFKEKKIVHLEGKTISDSITGWITGLESGEYYSQKYSLDFSKEIRSKIRYYKIKHHIYRITNNKNEKSIKEIINLLEEKMIKLGE